MGRRWRDPALIRLVAREYPPRESAPVGGGDGSGLPGKAFRGLSRLQCAPMRADVSVRLDLGASR